MRCVRQIFLILGAAWFCGCEKQAKTNGEKLDSLAGRLARQEQVQSNKMLLLQAQLALLAPQLDKETAEYFEKNKDAALFFHTNTLFLLLRIDRHIEEQLAAAAAERAGQNETIHNYHTNQLGTLLYCTAQIEETMQNQLNQLEEKINAESARLNAASSNALIQQMKNPAPTAADEIAWRKQIQVELAAFRHELEMLKSRLPAAPTNLPAAP